MSLQICANLAIAFAPFLPFSVEKLNHILNVAALDSALTWDDLGSSDLFPTGHKLNKAELLFAKIEDAQVEAQIAKLNATKIANEIATAEQSDQEDPAIAPAKAECTFDDFQAMDIRTATVLEAERVPKTDKLLKLTIDTGLDNALLFQVSRNTTLPKRWLASKYVFWPICSHARSAVLSPRE